jgi:hypothetical protein
MENSVRFACDRRVVAYHSILSRSPESYTLAIIFRFENEPRDGLGSPSVLIFMSTTVVQSLCED